MTALSRMGLLACLGVAALAAAPAHAFRCGSQLVHDGDSRAAVAAKCGEPTEISRSAILRKPVFWVGGRRYHVSGDFVEIPVEQWLYNLGPRKLMRRVRFEDGLVVEIETLGYGFRER